MSRLEEIKERLELKKYTRTLCNAPIQFADQPYSPFRQDEKDIEYLLAEIERLREENELKTERISLYAKSEWKLEQQVKELSKVGWELATEGDILRERLRKAEENEWYNCFDIYDRFIGKSQVEPKKGEEHYFGDVLHVCIGLNKIQNGYNFREVEADGGNG